MNGTASPWLLLVACSSPIAPSSDERSGCVVEASISREALVSAGDADDYLAMSDMERGALGMFGPSRPKPACSGVRLAPGWALSAGHCSAIAGASFYANDGGVQHVAEWREHPELDVALARLEAGDCGSQAGLVEPSTTPTALSRATLAGYGLTGEGTLGRLQFLVEAVTSIDEATVEVNGFGRSGACAGDSGGPLLIRDAAGRVAVLGVLSAGAPSCLEQDLYVRVEPLREWLQSNLELEAPSDECGALDGRGRCFDDRATYCENGRLRSDTCAGTTSCGFATEAAGYRCAEQPQCRGDAFGFCDGPTAIRCDEAGETARQCDAEGLGCGYDPLTGAATCL